MTKKRKIRFNRKGSVIVTDTYMLDSPNYNSLSKESKLLMIRMHQHWRYSKFVDYGIREACEKVPCSKMTAIRAFKELQKKGFIELME